MAYRDRYEKHHQNTVNVKTCALRMIKIYSVSQHRSCYYDLRRVLLSPERLIFERHNLNITIKNNVAYLDISHHHLSFNVKHLIGLKRKLINSRIPYFVSTLRNNVDREICFLYRNYIFHLVFFNHDYKKILNTFHNSRISNLNLKRIKQKCYLRNNYRQAVSLHAKASRAAKAAQIAKAVKDLQAVDTTDTPKRKHPKKIKDPTKITDSEKTTPTSTIKK